MFMSIIPLERLCLLFARPYASVYKAACVSSASTSWATPGVVSFGTVCEAADAVATGAASFRATDVASPTPFFRFFDELARDVRSEDVEGIGRTKAREVERTIGMPVASESLRINSAGMGCGFGRFFVPFGRPRFLGVDTGSCAESARPEDGSKVVPLSSRPFLAEGFGRFLEPFGLPRRRVTAGPVIELELVAGRDDEVSGAVAGLGDCAIRSSDAIWRST